MSEAARVIDSSALEDAKVALAEHAEAVKSLFIGIEADVQRMDSWLTRDMPSFWKRRIRELEEDVLRAKSKIATKRLAAAPEPASVVEETIALRKAQTKLDHARAKAQKVKFWSVRWRQEAPLYRAACRGLIDAANRDAPAAIARLNLMLRRLEEYKAMRPVRPGEAPALGSDFVIDPDAHEAPAPDATDTALDADSGKEGET